MAKQMTCPFCGRRGLRSNEHVWAQWLHATPGAKALLLNAHGERIERVHTTMRMSTQGKYEAVVEQSGAYAKWLPNVTVFVCRECNSGWMSGLESDVKAILEPFILNGQPITLGTGELERLTTWVTKSAMAYALTTSRQQNPFTVGEYRSMSSDPKSLDRSRTWMLHSQDPRAHVALGLSTWLITGRGQTPDLAADADNAGFCYLAVGSAVYITLFLPEGLPVEAWDIYAPPFISNGNVQQIWPDPQPHPFPADAISSEALEAFFALPTLAANATGLPTIGLKPEEVGEVSRRFLAGEDPANLRAEYGTPDWPT